MTLKQLLAMGAIGASLCLTAPAIADEPGEPDECGASALQDRIGESVSGTTVDDLRIGGEPVSIPAKAVRVVEEGQPMTMDFREDRLTIEVDEDGNMLTARCV